MLHNVRYLLLDVFKSLPWEGISIYILSSAHTLHAQHMSCCTSVPSHVNKFRVYKLAKILTARDTSIICQGDSAGGKKIFSFLNDHDFFFDGVVMF